MTAIAKVVSELFMFVLTVISAPSDLKEFRVDCIQHSGVVETMIVRRTDNGFTLLEQQGDQMVEKGYVRPVTGKPATFSFREGNAPEQTFDFAAAIPGMTLDGLQKAKTLDLKASDGGVIHVHRSGKAVYLTPERERVTYACH